MKLDNTLKSFHHCMHFPLPQPCHMLHVPHPENKNTSEHVYLNTEYYHIHDPGQINPDHTFTLYFHNTHEYNSVNTFLVSNYLYPGSYATPVVTTNRLLSYFKMMLPHQKSIPTSKNYNQRQKCKKKKNIYIYI
jgi:hypothetical protein